MAVRTKLRSAILAVVVLASPLLGVPARADATSVAPPSDALSQVSSHVRDGDGAGLVTVYGATWCPSCKALEATLRDRKIPFDLVDVDREPARYEMARKASGTNGVPLTNVIRGPQVSWILGNDADAVERAYKGG